MRAVDTNVLVRLIVRDTADQVAEAEKFIAPGAWVSLIVLVEAVWVWTSVYGAQHREIVHALERLLNLQQLVLQDPELVSAALDRFRTRPGLKFSDCMIVELARKGNFLPLGTFDRDLAKLDGAVRL